MSLVIRSARLAEVAALRQAALRPGQPLDSTRYDEDATALHIAAFDGDVVVGTATFFPQPFAEPGEADGPLDALLPAEAVGRIAWRLRGMATDASWRSTGVGSAVLAAGLEAVHQAGGELVWCNARTAALTFYRRHGFRPLGSEFLSGGTVKVPHYRAWVPLALPSG